MGSALFTKWSSAEENGNCQGHYEERKRALCGTENVCHTRLYILIFSWDFRGCQTLPFSRGQTMPRFPKNSCHRVNQNILLGAKFPIVHSHDIPTKPNIFPLLLQAHKKRGRGQIIPNFLPIFLSQNPSIFPEHHFIFLSRTLLMFSRITGHRRDFYEEKARPFIFPSFSPVSHFMKEKRKKG